MWSNSQLPIANSERLTTYSPLSTKSRSPFTAHHKLSTLQSCLGDEYHFISTVITFACMRHLWNLLIPIVSVLIAGAQITNMNVYLIPGQGADHRLFDSLELGEGYNTIHIQYSMPEKGMSMRDYAKELALQIDTSQPFILIGVSLGGMLSVEMKEFLNPERTIIISSAKSRKELPFRYRFQKVIPLYKIVPPALSKKGAIVLQPIVEPDSKVHRNTFNSMLKDKDRQFFKRTIAMILEWNRKEYSGDIVHVHGDSDHTIPLKNVKCDYLVKGGSHMMTLTRGAEISRIVLEILEEN